MLSADDECSQLSNFSTGQTKWFYVLTEFRIIATEFLMSLTFLFSLKSPCKQIAREKPP